MTNLELKQCLGDARMELDDVDRILDMCINEFESNDVVVEQMVDQLVMVREFLQGCYFMIRNIDKVISNQQK